MESKIFIVGSLYDRISIMGFKKIYKRILLVAIILLGITTTYFITRCSIQQPIPFFDGIWANEDNSFILDTDNFTVTIAEADDPEVFDIGILPQIGYEMFYPLPKSHEAVSRGDIIHSGEVYRIKFFEIDYIRIKCDDGCFDVCLKKKNSETS